MNRLKKIKELEHRIGYHFQDFNLLVMAMRHSSYVNEHHMERLDCNERLEFLGDAVLEVVSSEFLYKNFPELPDKKTCQHGLRTVSCILRAADRSWQLSAAGQG